MVIRPGLGAIVTTWTTSGAASQAASPAWLAVTVQAPEPVRVSSVGAVRLQVPEAEKATVRPLVADAARLMGASP